MTHWQGKVPRIVLSAMGRGGHGKTDFWTTMPTPILALSTDPNTEDVVEKVYGEKIDDIDHRDLQLVHIPYPMVGFESREEDVEAEARESWALIMDTLRPVVNRTAKIMPASVVLDTGTEIDTLNILAEFGRTDKIPPAVRRIKMGNVNNNYKGLFRGLEKAGVHVCVTHRCRERWETVEVRTPKGIEEKDRVVPGQYDRIGFKQTENIVNTEVLLMFDPERGGKISHKFGMRITRSMIRPALVEQEYWGKSNEGVRMPSFPYLATLLYPRTTLAEWGWE